ncbi:flavin-containing monooxygenase 5-like [Antedon mediterranea]|uniref:flavin-containing monooxygenase 5-like n=1 Tax=Antedon mediterranea TaxID=105859 RepID=UPI003AF977C6
MVKHQSEADVCVIGAGISGLVTAKCLKEKGFKVVILEQTELIGGLWCYRDHGYGVMRFTHINVSKHNYSFSDFPFPEDVPDFPHNRDMAQYINDYVVNFGLDKLIHFNTKVDRVERSGDGWKIAATKTEKGGSHLSVSEEIIYHTKYVAIATGHHAEPKRPYFPGQNTFKGQIIHSVDYKDAISNGFTGKRVLIVGIGNSAVDAAVDCATTGRCKQVVISTRSGAWVIPNYIFGLPTDHYASRLFLWLPWKVSNFIFEKVVSIITGSPEKWKLNPKMKILQTQPTVSPTLIHHIQRGNIQIKPNITKIDGSTVHFTDGTSIDTYCIVYCTGYSISLPFLDEDIKRDILDNETNQITLYKNVFSPRVGSSLAFIGFVQPASGGILTMSETQAMWFTQLCRQKVKLPSPKQMQKAIKKENEDNEGRYYKSARHTIQKDPILYNDEIASLIGSKPQLWRHPTMAIRLLLSSCGAAQWRLQGPFQWSGASETVRNTPIANLYKFSSTCILLLILYVIYKLVTLFC